MPLEHAKYNPSGAKKWAYCMGAIELEAVALENLGWSEWPAEEYAEEGEWAHGVLERCLVYGITPEQAGSTTPEMQAAVQLALDYIYTEANNRGLQILVEQRVHIADDCWGTSDIILHNDGPEIDIEVVDFKYGEGVFVPIEDNDQLDLYAIGVLAKIDPMDTFGETQQIKETIIQPRIPLGHHYYHQEFLAIAGPIRSTNRYISDLRERKVFFLGAIERQGPSYSPGRETCRWCHAKGICLPATRHALEQAQVIAPGMSFNLEAIEKNSTMRPSELTPEERRIVLETVELIRAQLKAVEAYSLELALAGKPIEGFKLVESLGGQRKWREDDEQMLKILGNFKHKEDGKSKSVFTKAEITKTQLLGPAPIEKLAKARRKEGKLTEKQLTRLNSHIVKPPGKRTLVPDADIRPALAMTPEKMFEGVKPTGESKP